MTRRGVGRGLHPEMGHDGGCPVCQQGYLPTGPDRSGVLDLITQKVVEAGDRISRLGPIRHEVSARTILLRQSRAGIALPPVDHEMAESGIYTRAPSPEKPAINRRASDFGGPSVY